MRIIGIICDELCSKLSVDVAVKGLREWPIQRSGRR